VRLTRLAVADGMPLFRSGVRRLLEREADFEVIEAGSLEELLREADRSVPDVALIDLDLPPRGGVAAAAALSDCHDTQTIVWSFRADREAVLASVRAGAVGYLEKEIAPAALVRALRGLVRGEAPLSRRLALLLIDGIHSLDARDRSRERASALSKREREVLEMVAQGARNKQVAASLEISEFTVKRHMQNILQKLDLPSRRAAAAFYRSAADPETVAISS
jgi:two-component system nitrate/nitrite response regulator NarL